MRTTSVFKDTIIKKGSCPPGCKDCWHACATREGGPGIGLINPLSVEEIPFHGVTICNQCSQPQCMEICPSNAIALNLNGLPTIDQEKCAGCGLCTLACPNGEIFYLPDRKKAFKCDYCDGEPRCVRACPYGLLSFAKSRSVLNLIGCEDHLMPGTSLCPGCPVELALRFSLRVLGENVILFTGPGCAAVAATGFMDLGTTMVANMNCLMTNVPSTMSGVKAYFRKIGQDATCVAFCGDGLTCDVGFQPLSGAAERGENIIYICYDNEGYMNTGIQRSSTTPLSAWTTTTPVGKAAMGGKTMSAKNVPLIMAFHLISYTATATLSHLEDFAKKLSRAKSTGEGMSYIHVLTPCPTGWGGPPEKSIEMCRKAVETNYFPLWESEKGQFRLTCEVTDPKPIKEFTQMMRRFEHLTEDDLKRLQKEVDSRFNLIKGLTSIKFNAGDPDFFRRVRNKPWVETV